jgi:hypothetical protein
MTELRALTIWQPWAVAIAHWGKDVENRTWQCYRRGLIAIHAGAGVGTHNDYRAAIACVADLTGRPAEDITDGSQIRSAIIAVANLTDVCSKSRHFPFAHLKCTCGLWAQSGQRHFKLTDVVALPEPVPCKGSQQLWILPPEVESAVRAQLGWERAA